MKNQVVMRKITVIWVDMKTGESARERKFVWILAAVLSAALAGLLIFWR